MEHLIFPKRSIVEWAYEEFVVLNDLDDRPKSLHEDFEWFFVWKWQLGLPYRPRVLKQNPSTRADIVSSIYSNDNWEEEQIDVSSPFVFNRAENHQSNIFFKDIDGIEISIL